MSCHLLDGIFAQEAKKPNALLDVSFVFQVADFAPNSVFPVITASGSGQIKYFPAHRASLSPHSPVHIIIPASFNGIVNCDVSEVQAGAVKSLGSQQVTVQIMSFGLTSDYMISFLAENGPIPVKHLSFTPVCNQFLNLGSLTINGVTGVGLVSMRVLAL